jgi:cell division protease FtsH
MTMPRHGEHTRQRIDEAVRGIVMDAFARASELLQARRAALERGAKELLVRETLDEAALKEVLGIA